MPATERRKHEEQRNEERRKPPPPKREEPAPDHRRGADQPGDSGMHGDEDG
jgi:hypothetical protein